MVPTLWRTIIGNSALLLIARAIAKVATVAATVVIARELSAGPFGVFSAVLAITSLAGLLADFGLVLPTIRSVSRGEETPARLVGKTAGARLLWSLVAAGTIIGSGAGLGLPGAALGAFACSAILDILSGALVRTFEGRQMMKTVTAFTLIERVTFCALVIAAAAGGGGLEAVAWAYLASSGLALGYALFLFRRAFGMPAPDFSFRKAGDAMRAGFPFLLTALFSAVYYKADVLLLSALRGDVDAGIYTAAMRIIEAQMFIPMALMASVFPVLSALFLRDGEGFARVFRRSLVGLLLLGAVIGGGLLAFSPSVVDVLYAEAFSDSQTVLVVLAPMLVFYFVNFLLSQALIAMSYESIFTAIMGGAAVVNLVANALIIPGSGVLGAAWVRFAVEALMTVAFATAMSGRLRGGRPPLRSAEETSEMSGSALV